jgi:hypothetical protein
MSEQEQPQKPEFETCDDLLRAILAILPTATIEEDNFGQICIYTDLIETGDGKLRRATIEDFE